jgi:hypothetical protein
LLANGWWFSPASSTTKTGRYEIAEILLKVALNTKNKNKNQWRVCRLSTVFGLNVFRTFRSLRTFGLFRTF